MQWANRNIPERYRKIGERTLRRIRYKSTTFSAVGSVSGTPWTQLEVHAERFAKLLLTVFVCQPHFKVGVSSVPVSFGLVVLTCKSSTKNRLDHKTAIRVASST